MDCFQVQVFLWYGRWTIPWCCLAIFAPVSYHSYLWWLSMRDAARKVRYQVRMVTLDGTELRTGILMLVVPIVKINSIFIKPELEQLQKRLLKKKNFFAKRKKIQVSSASWMNLVNFETIKSQESKSYPGTRLVPLSTTSQQVEKNLRHSLKLQELRIEQSLEGDLASWKKMSRTSRNYCNWKAKLELERGNQVQ